MDARNERPAPESGRTDNTRRRETATAGFNAHHAHRERDYGIGYGNSSGYGSDRHFIDGHVDPIFSCR
jgi:hypothetical protein